MSELDEIAVIAYRLARRSGLNDAEADDVAVYVVRKAKEAVSSHEWRRDMDQMVGV